MGERIVFTIAAATAIACAILVITQKSPFRATVALIGTLRQLYPGGRARASAWRSPQRRAIPPA